MVGCSSGYGARSGIGVGVFELGGFVVDGGRGSLDAPPPVQRYKPGTWGPKAADKLVAGRGRWQGPWIAS